jgi:protoporphyrin/coproporphyrin ferrochelatase
MPSAELILVNLGTPETPTAPAVRDFLAEFLGDPMVVEKPRWLWLPILHGIVLRRRPAPVAKAYAEIWQPDGAQGGSPLAVGTRALAAATQALAGDDLHVTFAYRYGATNLRSRLLESQRRWPDSDHPIRVVSLFPQRTASSSGTVEVLTRRLAAELGMESRLSAASLSPVSPGYINSIAAGIEAAVADAPEPAHLLASFHGIPEYVNANEGGRYTADCQATFAALLERLGWAEDHVPAAFSSASLTYQSKFGRDPWIGPATDQCLAALGKQGGSIVVATPGFLTAGLETIEEMGLRGRDTFLEAGGRHFGLAKTPIAHHQDHSPTPDSDLVRALLGLVTT